MSWFVRCLDHECHFSVWIYPWTPADETAATCYAHRMRAGDGHDVGVAGHADVDTLEWSIWRSETRKSRNDCSEQKARRIVELARALDRRSEAARALEHARAVHARSMIALYRREKKRHHVPPWPTGFRTHRRKLLRLPSEFGQWTPEYRAGLARGLTAGRASIDKPFISLPGINPLSSIGGSRLTAWNQGYREGWKAGRARARLTA